MGAIEVRVARNWTADEDKLLGEWQEHFGNKWSKIAEHIPGKTGQQCAQRWRHKGNPKISKERWNPEEDAILAEMVRKLGNQWATIARKLPGRTDQQCMGRWRRRLDPEINHGPWDNREDGTLEGLVDRIGPHWAEVAQHFRGRTAQQCRSRFIKLRGSRTTMLGASEKRALSTSPELNRRRSKRGHQLRKADVENCSDRLMMAAKSSMKPSAQSTFRQPLAERRPLDINAGAGPQPFPKSQVQPQQNGPRSHLAADGTPIPTSTVDRQDVCNGIGAWSRAHIGQKGCAASISCVGLQQILKNLLKSVMQASLQRHELHLLCPLVFWRKLKEGKHNLLLQAESETSFVDALFFWLQLLLLQPLQPVLTVDATLLSSRLQQLTWVSALAFLLYCNPRC